MAHRNLQEPKEKCVFLLCGPYWEAQFRILCSIAYILEVLSNFRLVSGVTFLETAFPVVRTHITQIRRAINICRIRLKHVMTIPSSCSRPFQIACFLSRICSPVPKYKSKIAGRRCAFPRGPSSIVRASVWVDAFLHGRSKPEAFICTKRRKNYGNQT